MGFLGNFINEDNDEVLLFILVFLSVFNGSMLDTRNTEAGGLGNNLILFFIAVFLLLFLFNSNSNIEPA